MFPATNRFQREILLLCAKVQEKDDQRRRRRWQHRLMELQPIEGAYEILYPRLRRFPTKFFQYMRMSIETFDQLLELVSPAIQRQDTRLLGNISPAQRLMVTLRFLATGENFSSLHFQFWLRKSTIAVMVIDTCMAIWDCLQSQYMPVPNAELWTQIASHFLQTTQFPNCLGAIDGKHVRIQKPTRTGSECFNYNNDFSIVLMAIADSHYRFVAVDIGAFGCSNISKVFTESNMGRKLYAANFDLPAPKPLPGTEDPQPFVLVGDEVFKMSAHLLKPYSSQSLNYQRRVFNYRLKRARRVVECAFGILVAKWRIFHKPIQLKVESIDHAVKACTMLHNFVMAKEPPLVDPFEYQSLAVPAAYPNHSSQAVARQRDTFAEYFLSEAGWLELQDRMA